MTQKVILFLLLAVICTPAALNAQGRLATAYLNNGSVLIGQLSKSNSSDKYRIVIPNGSTIFFTGNEVKNIVYGQGTNASAQQYNQGGEEATAYLQNGSTLKGRLKKSGASDTYRMLFPNGSMMFFLGRLVANIEYQNGGGGGDMWSSFSSTNSGGNSSSPQATELLKGGFGLVGGYNSSSLTIKNIDSYSAAHVGFSILTPMDDNKFYTTGVLLSIKGAQSGDQDATYTRSYTFVEVPVHFGYVYPVNEQISLFGSAGAYAGFAISGKDKSEYVNDPDDNEEEDLYDKEINNDGYNKRFNLGLTGRAGIVYDSNLHVYAGYDYGIMNLTKEKKYPIQERTLYLAVAWYF